MKKAKIDAIPENNPDVQINALTVCLIFSLLSKNFIFIIKAVKPSSSLLDQVF